MASLVVRFKNGEVDEWPLAEASDLDRLVRTLTRTTGTLQTVSLGIPSEDGGSADSNFTGIVMKEVISWHVTGMFDASSAAALFA